MREAVVSNRDPNRHLPELNARVPVLVDGPNGAARKQKIDRPRLDPIDPDGLADRLDIAMRHARKSGLEAEECDSMEKMMEECVRHLLTDRNNYYGRANELDRRSHANWLSTGFSNILVFILDLGVCSGSGFVLLTSLNSHQPIPLFDSAQMAIGALFLGTIGATLAKKFAPQAVSNKVFLALYVLVWLLYAAADFQYLFKNGAGGAALVLTALVILMAGVTYAQASKSTASNLPRKQALKAYDDAYTQYQERLHKWEHAIDMLERHPERGIPGLKEILKDAYFNFRQGQAKSVA